MLPSARLSPSEIYSFMLECLGQRKRVLLSPRSAAVMDAGKAFPASRESIQRKRFTDNISDRPCKSRKVKCDEAHPSCLNCQRQGETCDYSIRLNWDGRGKKKAEGEGAGGQIIFSSNMITSVLGKPSNEPIVSPAMADTPDGASPSSNNIMDSPDGSLGYVNSQRPSTSGSGAPEPYARYSPSPTSIRYRQPFQQYSNHPSPTSSMIDPILMDHSPLAENLSSGPYDRVYPPPNDLTYSQSYERHHQMATNRNGLVQQAAIARFRADPIRRSGPPSPSEANAESPGTSIFNDQDTPTSIPLVYTNDYGDADERSIRHDTAALSRPSKRMRYDYPSQESSDSGMPPMPPPHPSNSPYPYSMNTLAPISAISQLGSGVPLTPTASSTYSDDGFKSYITKLSPFAATDNRDDPRRLSVESLLSGPPGIPYQPSRTSFSGLTPEAPTYRSHQSTSSGGEKLEEMTTWGLDRGFKDLDEGKNDDTNAISGGSPTVKRENLDSETDEDGDYVPTEFGFGIQAKDTAFEKGNYYQKYDSRLFHRLCNLLTSGIQTYNYQIAEVFRTSSSVFNGKSNELALFPSFHITYCQVQSPKHPKSIVFFADIFRILVPHHCSANPFQNILPKMALQDANLMNLLLAYSASHRARLLQQPEPAIRIARWVKDIFPNLRHDLNDPSRIVSNSNLATAIMLASLEIISPKAFGVAIPWQKHLGTARQIIAARGGAKSIHRDRSRASDFLLRWFAYLDILGSLIGGPNDLPSAGGNGEGVDYDLDDGDEENDYQIDCLLGFTSRCVTILAKIAHLAKISDSERIDCNQNIRADWKPDEKTEARAEKLISDLENARTNTRIQPCPHLHSAGEAAYQWDFQEMQATNEAYHYAGLVHVHRRILGKPSSHPDVQTSVREISGALYKVRKGSTAESCLLFPMFTAGCDSLDEKQRNAIMERFRGVEEFGMSHVCMAKILMNKC
jgi:hypothetical protein